MPRHFKSFIDGFMEYSANVEAPEKFLRWSAISVIAGALERKTWLIFNGSFVHPNEYIMLIGAPGMAKKSSSSGKAFDLLQELDDVNLMSTQLTAASLVKQLEKAGQSKTIDIGGERYANASLYLYSSEASVTLKEITGSVTELMTDFYDCGGAHGWSNKKYWSKETVGGGRTQLYHPCLNMLACSTPDKLLKVIGKEQISDGFASRILFVVQLGKPERVIGWSDDEVDTQTLVLKRKLIADLGAINKLQGQFRVEKAVKELGNAIKLKIDTYIEENQQDVFIGYYGRKLWHILKLAQILSASESDNLEICVRHVQAAVALVEDLELTMKHAFGVVGTNDKAGAFHAMWEIIRAKKSISKRELLRLNWRNADARTFDEHLKTLIEMHKIGVRVVGKDIVFDVLDKTPLF